MKKIIVSLSILTVLASAVYAGGDKDKKSCSESEKKSCCASKKKEGCAEKKTESNKTEEKKPQ